MIEREGGSQIRTHVGFFALQSTHILNPASRRCQYAFLRLYEPRGGGRSGREGRRTLLAFCWRRTPKMASRSFEVADMVQSWAVGGGRSGTSNEERSEEGEGERVDSEGAR